MADTDEDIEKVEHLPEEVSLAADQDRGATSNSKAKSQHEQDLKVSKEDEVEGAAPKVRYNTEDFISGPKRVKNGTVPMTILEFHHSYGYDCRRHFNLCVPDPNTIVFASGNLINFLDVPGNRLRFRRGSTGGGIGHITKNPLLDHIAIGENGIDPPIIIYEWPNMEIVTILQGGTTRSYSHLAYSPDGKLLVSQGGDPDYMITVWDWQRSKIMLRCKSYGQEIYNVVFSPSVPGHLTSSGSGHIKFWKMAKTFTGLKLQGELGRFGKTEISDIVGVYPMPDEKVISGCEWGNILLWDEGLIKLEVCKKNRKTCHDKLITQFEYSNGELMSVGMDGWIRIWFYETIDQADPPDEDRFIEIEPIYEFRIVEEDDEHTGDPTQNSMLMCVQKQIPDDPEDTWWYAQDGNGGLWLIDLCTFHQPEPPRKILACHAGPVTDMDVATWGPFVATCGTDGRLHIYNYSEKRLILIHKFRDTGCRVVWLPCTMEPTGSTLIYAFGSGIIRMIAVAVLKANASSDARGDCVRLIQVLKPHTMPITAVSLNTSHRYATERLTFKTLLSDGTLSNSLLVTGSEDSTIFVFHVRTTEAYPSLVPIGYVKVPSGVTCMTWKPKRQTTLLVGCSRGDCVEVELPARPQSYTTVTYELVHCEPRFFKFQSVKSGIRRELYRLEIEGKKAAKIARKREEMEQLIASNPGMEIDEEAFLMDSEEDPPLPDIYVPEVPNRVLMANYTPNDTVWLSMAGFDAGYFYEYPNPLPGKHANEPISSKVIADADDTEIRSCLFYEANKYVFLGMEHGEIRVCRVNPHDYTDLSDYWSLPMHDNSNGFIPKMLQSHDRKMLLTCGHDGNLFSFTIHDDAPLVAVDIPKARRLSQLPPENVEDIEEPGHPSLEEVIVQAECNRILSVAKQKKDRTLDMLRGLAEEYGSVMDRNRRLLKSQQIPQEEFELDPRITADLNRQLKAEMNLMHKKLSFKVEKSKLGLQKLLDYFIEPITCLPFAVRRILRPETMVHSLRERKLGVAFDEAYDEVKRRIEARDKAGRVADVRSIEEEEEDEEHQKIEGVESFLKGLTPSTIENRLGVKINQILRKYRARKARLEERQKEWKTMYASKPDPNVNHPDDVIAIEHAKNTIGDYKLKVSPNFNTATKERANTLNKYKEFLDCKKKLHYLREDFNAKLKATRTKKLALQQEAVSLVDKLKTIHTEIPEKRVKPLPIVPTFDHNVEFPEKNLELEKYTSMAERVKEARRKKKSFVTEVVSNPVDEEYEVLLLDEKTIQLDEDNDSLELLTATIPEKKHKLQIAMHGDFLQSLAASDRIETPWEREMKRARVKRKVHEQDFILKHIESSYEELDEELDKLERERLEIVADSVYMDLFLLTLHQELIVLKDFEAMENQLAEKVEETLKNRTTAKQKLQTMSVKIDQRGKEIAKLQDKIKDLFAEYTSMIKDNKFYDFLRRIFKKKYKSPKGDEESTSSSSSSSESSSEDDDAGSVDSRDIGPIHFDENICPVGCDKELYESAFSMRKKRYEYEHEIKEEQRAIEMLRKEFDGDSKKMKLIEASLRSGREDLQAFMREKQRKLNDIDMTVILKFHQLQHFVDPQTVAMIRDCVVFDKEKLSRLYARIAELQQESLEQKAKHNKNRMHLRRMNLDCKYMEGEIKKLKDDIKRAMMCKFGQEIPLNVLQEAVLRRMVYDIKADLKEMIKSFDAEVKCVKDKYAEQVEILEDLIQDNTEKLSFLTVLEEEQMKLRKISTKVPMSEEAVTKVEIEYQDDLAKLEDILKSQMEQKELFRNEIKNLSLKTRPLPPICPKGKERKEGEKKREDDNSLLTEIDIRPVDQPPFSQDEAIENVPAAREITDDRGDKSENVALTDNSKEDDTAMMVHRILSQLIRNFMGDEEPDEGVREILRGIISNLPIGADGEELRISIEQSVEHIVAALPSDVQENARGIREEVQEILNDIILKLHDEARRVDVKMRNAAKVRTKIKEFLHAIGIVEGFEALEDALPRLLGAEPSADAAVNYLLSTLPTDTSEEAKATLREHASNVFADIREEMKIDYESEMSQTLLAAEENDQPLSQRSDDIPKSISESLSEEEQ